MREGVRGRGGEVGVCWRERGGGVGVCWRKRERNRVIWDMYTCTLY